MHFRFPPPPPGGVSPPPAPPPHNTTKQNNKTPKAPTTTDVIYARSRQPVFRPPRADPTEHLSRIQTLAASACHQARLDQRLQHGRENRTEERRVGKECRIRWSASSY